MEWLELFFRHCAPRALESATDTGVEVSEGWVFLASRRLTWTMRRRTPCLSLFLDEMCTSRPSHNILVSQWSSVTSVQHITNPVFLLFEKSLTHTIHLFVQSSNYIQSVHMLQSRALMILPLISAPLVPLSVAFALVPISLRPCQPRDKEDGCAGVDLTSLI